MKKYTELDVGDVVSVIDTASNNDKEYTISITSVEYDEDFVTKTNPKGVHYHGTCLDVLFNDEHITNVDENNFVDFCYTKSSNATLYCYEVHPSFADYQKGKISDEEWEQAGAIVLSGIAEYPKEMQRFNLTKEDVENLYDGNINLKTIDALSIWEDIMGIENYIDNCIISKELLDEELEF